METVCIPRERYEYLVKCERLVAMEFEEKFSDEFIAEVKESEEAYERGEYIEVENREEREKLFESLWFRDEIQGEIYIMTLFTNNIYR